MSNSVNARIEYFPNIYKMCLHDLFQKFFKSVSSVQNNIYAIIMLLYNVL